MTVLSDEQLLGVDDSHVVALECGGQLQAEVADALAQLQDDARGAGFDLSIASAFRSFERQLLIFNGKASGERDVHDDAGCLLDISHCSEREWLAAILRFSALPGTSRHHWGTDLDVFDSNALAEGEQVALTPDEVAPGGVFDDLHCWLDARMAAGRSYGFFRPYNIDRGGVACERWHLSYAPLSLDYAKRVTPELLLTRYQGLPPPGLMLLDSIAPVLKQLYERYVVVGEDWCLPTGDNRTGSAT